MGNSYWIARGHHALDIGRSLLVSMTCLVASHSAFGLDVPVLLTQGLAKCGGEFPKAMDCAQAIETRLLAKDSNVAIRIGQLLTLHLERNTIRLENNNSEDAEKAIKHSYLGYIRSLNAHVLHVQYYEGDGFMLVHHRTGTAAYPSGFPSVSPDGAHFLSTSRDMEAGYSLNGIEVWRVSNNGFEKLITFQVHAWGPGSVSWLDATRGEVQKTCLHHEKQVLSYKKCGSAIVEYTQSGWRLSE